MDSCLRAGGDAAYEVVGPLEPLCLREFFTRYEPLKIKSEYGDAMLQNLEDTLQTGPTHPGETQEGHLQGGSNRAHRTIRADLRVRVLNCG